jgi:hypothetical protein
MKRITVNLDEEIIEKLRKHQAELILKENRNVSISEIVNIVLEKGFKK